VVLFCFQEFGNYQVLVNLGVARGKLWVSRRI
jgi:hypothetical protein